MFGRLKSTIDATEADVLRYQLEDKRQRDLLRTGIAGTQQLVEQADANAKKTLAQRRLNDAQLDQQKAALAAIDTQEKQVQAQIKAAEAQVALASDNLRYTRILSPADGLLGQRQVRLGQFVNVGTQVVAVLPLPNLWVMANYKETQMTDIRLGQPARIAVDAFPDLKLTGRVDSGRRERGAPSRCFLPTTRPATSPKSSSASRSRSCSTRTLRSERW